MLPSRMPVWRIFTLSLSLGRIIPTKVMPKYSELSQFALIRERVKLTQERGHDGLSDNILNVAASRSA